MPSQFFHALSKASPATLTPSLSLLAQASTASFAVAATFVTLSASFARLAEEEKLFADLSRPEERSSDATEQLIKKITGITLPKSLSLELHQLYHQGLGAGFVRIQCWTQYGSTPWLSEIKGDANIAESLVTAWTSAIELNVHHGASLVEAVTNCQAVIQAQPASPVACGELFSRHPDSGERYLLVIKLRPGAPHAAMTTDVPTQYTVDVRTGMIVQRQVGTSKQRAKRQADSLVLEQQHETAEFHNEKELLDLVRQFNAFKRQFNHHLYATFEVEGETLWLTSVAQQKEERNPVRQPVHLVTKVYIATGSAGSLDITAHEHADGIGLLRAEYIFSQLELHPLSLIKKGRADVIADRVASLLKEADHSYPDRRILYRLQNLTTHELAAFKNGLNQEKEEPNPYLGWRGGLRVMEQPELFEPELATFAKWLKRRHAPTGLIVPFVRSTAEWRWIVNRWRERQFFDHPEFENWFQITTPENISNLEGYVLPEVFGITLNIRTVIALMSGIDPDDPQLQASYPPPIELAQTILSEVSQKVAFLRTQSTHGNLKLHLHLEDYNHALVSSAVKHKYDGIVLQPAALLVGRNCIGEAEKL